MLKITTEIRIAKHILWVCFLLLALSPCTVKAALFDSVNVEYTKPLNKSKVTIQTNSCQYAQIESQHVSIAKQAKAIQEMEAVVFYRIQNFTIRSSKIYSKYSKNCSGNSPPKYILYKRLKLDIA